MRRWIRFMKTPALRGAATALRDALVREGVRGALAWLWDKWSGW